MVSWTWVVKVPGGTVSEALHGPILMAMVAPLGPTVVLVTTDWKPPGATGGGGGGP